MTTCVLCNVGVRDVVIDGKLLDPPRLQGEHLLTHYNEFAGRLAFPIIAPCLDYILAQQPGVIALYLFGTDQADAAYRANDTVHAAQLAARRLAEMYDHRISRAEALSITGINPSLYDEAFEAFDHLLSTLSVHPDDACYVILCGGTPACNSALLLQGVRHYASRLRAVYLPQRGEPQELRVGQQIVNAFSEAAAIEHLRQLDFANARTLLEKLPCPSGLIHLVAYAEQRQAFDFASAQRTLLAALRDGDADLRAFITTHLRHSLDDLLHAQDSTRQLRALLQELYWNAAVTYAQRRYADFLGRVYRFQEAVLRYLVELIFKLPTDLSEEMRAHNQAVWNAGIQANTALRHFLEQQPVGNGDKRLDWAVIARPAYQAMLSFAVGDSGADFLSTADRQRYAALLKRVNAFDRLVELRHRTIIGHGFQGISEPIILDHYMHRSSASPYRSPVQGLAEIMHMLGANVQDDPYQMLANYVIARLCSRPT